ncbi:MAG: cytochrome-c oxidase, cbb3-type subunit II, partial [Myxococcales bacterium]|nr:cytochrome-c oxidase, cbb3-type subunit II [Myxococcales bacterium]
ILGIMYYFLPKAADRPVFSYRLSIIHFWGLVFIYIWAGPHHLLYTALPDWAQTLGMIFSLMLWAPSWGGMLNGLMTLRGAWDKLRADPVLKFFAAGLTFYGMATFEGPLLSIKSVSALAHYTDWIIGHVHAGALGWNGFMAAGMFYWLVPRLYGTQLKSVSAANFHFWIGTFGILLYVTSMWTAGITQGLMWREMAEGGGLAYRNFVQTLVALRPMYWMRLIGGSLYLVGFIVMAWNLWATARSGKAVNGEAEVTVDDATPAAAEPSPKQLVLSPPVIVSAIVIGLVIAAGYLEVVASLTFVVLAFAVGFFTMLLLSLAKQPGKPTWHSLIEGRSGVFTALTMLAALVGGVAEIVPSVVAAPEALATTNNVPYSPLEVEGRDVYIREGCYTCHSQMIRPFTWETARYGAVSTPDDSIFDHPFQWGSRRIGPDLARIGGKYSHTWHYRHMMDPREISADSNMPPFAHLAGEALDFEGTAAKMRALRTVGVPYGAEQIQRSQAAAHAQAQEIADFLATDAGVRVCPTDELDPETCDLVVDSRMTAVIAYLQRVGRVPADGTYDVPATETVASNTGARP